MEMNLNEDKVIQNSRINKVLQGMKDSNKRLHD